MLRRKPIWFVWMLCSITLLLSGCGPGTAPAGPLPALSLIGMGLGLGDLLRPDGAARLYAYLKEIVGAGYAKEVRLVLDRNWEKAGMPSLESVASTLQGLGFKLIPVFFQGVMSGQVLDIDAEVAWLREALPKIKDCCLAAEFWNEPANPQIGPVVMVVPDAPMFAAFHNAMAKAVRELAPGLPILGPSVMGKTSWGWWEAVRGLIDYNIVSSHVYGVGDIYNPNYGSLDGHDKPVWVTEAGQLSYWRPWHQKYLLFPWNSPDPWARRPGGGILA